jgi:hypothetical protein
MACWPRPGHVRRTRGKKGLAAEAQAVKGLHDAGLVRDSKVQQPGAGKGAVHKTLGLQK